jgi:poly-gamma-glutamate capsule biosynthesis protein CapA/YwtB (metallophosphatase superfamily)
MLGEVKTQFWMSVAGDTMLGRLVDLIMPIHNLPISEEEGSYLLLLKQHHPVLNSVDEMYPFGDVLHILKEETDLSIINLETSITQTHKKLPKTFNYRMHPYNVRILKEAKIDYCSLANNHILDFGILGLVETMATLQSQRITFAGVGKTQLQACSPTFRLKNGILFSFLSASDHPEAWKTIPHFHYLNVNSVPEENLKGSIQEAKSKSDFLIFSLHWGPNYQWYPDASIRQLAHKLIDWGVDLIHGHSSHHVQGIEIYKGKPIFYGCGDFIDDYAVSSVFRNDLGCLYRLEWEVTTSESKDTAAEMEFPNKQLSFAEKTSLLSGKLFQFFFQLLILYHRKY